VGGSAQEWQAALDAGLTAGSDIELRLVMTAFGDEASLAYEVAIQTG
jgi:hypothetical protein